MNGLIVIGYPKPDDADQARQRLMELQKQKLIELDDAVVIERTPDGQVKLHQTRSTTAHGAWGGAMWGGLIGLVLLAPLLGAAIGAASGALAGSVSDTGVDDAFMTEFADQLPAGGAALILLVRSAETDRVLEQMHGQYGGTILRTSLSDEEEAQLQAAAAQAAAQAVAKSVADAARPPD